ncbi:related to transcriptional regulator ARG82 [Cephalotrichum gorgonifer]|uniref:Kinase n=1 Tax=Cephalotrichum gorgonifer TaxID=2041049 RepID=A0AAE8MUL7_9PEZI|nr:related to transcriptional regulator ARG82 [Cephalotrichum gorgonifer]
MADVEGELFFKPCKQTEIDFYESARHKYPKFFEIMPLYIGTLDLTDPADIDPAVGDVAAVTPVVPGSIGEPSTTDTAHAAANAAPTTTTTDPESTEEPSVSPTPEVKEGVTWIPNRDRRIKTNISVVLENLTHGYKKPNILDAKLGVRLWAPDAPLEKRQRFDAIAAETTHAKFGCRIAGMRVYKGCEDPAKLSEEGYRICDRDYGRVAVNNDNFFDEIRAFVFNKTAGISGELAKAICKGFAEELEKIETALLTHSMRLFSSSVLFIYEGDEVALREAIERNNEIADSLARESDCEGKEFEEVIEWNGDMADELDMRIPATIRIDSGIVMDGEDYEDAKYSFVDDDDVQAPSLPSIFTVKLIDFAHAEWAPGKVGPGREPFDGPDMNTLKGVQSLLKIFRDLST